MARLPMCSAFFTFAVQQQFSNFSIIGITWMFKLIKIQIARLSPRDFDSVDLEEGLYSDEFPGDVDAGL